MQNYNEQNRIQYFADILILIGLVVLCALIFGLIGAFLAAALYQIDYGDFVSVITDTSDTANMGFMKIYNAFSTLGAWVISGFLLVKIRSYSLNSLWKFKMPAVRFIWFLLPIMFISAVYVSAYLLDINQRLPFPENLVSYFESFNTSGILNRMLIMNNGVDLFINIIVIALLPAVFEEIFFRGTLQPLMIGIFKNHHIAIWITSMIFALIHLSLFQIMPMMFLALVIGYLFYYTESIYPSIFIHFFNNLLAVLAFYYQNQSKLAKQVVDDEFVPGMGSFIICLLILGTIFVFLIQQKKAESENE